MASTEKLSIVFVHENFPAQFGGIAAHLAANGWNVVFATAAEAIKPGKPRRDLIKGVTVVGYRRAREPDENIHVYLRGTESAILNGQAFVRLAGSLKKGGFTPDIVVAHSGWGSGSFARIAWPEAKFVQYLEWWYNYPAPDAEPHIKPRSHEDSYARSLCRNLPFLLDAQTSDAILVPTLFQADQIPPLLRDRVTVVHDGVDAGFYRPAIPEDDPFTFEGLPDNAPIITYATRGMEPIRGFPQFMAAWAALQDKHPNVHCVIAGTDKISYGAKLPEGQSYKKMALARHDFDPTRLHFVGHLRRSQYRGLLQRSDAHTYLTRPFVLSWSLIEAMLTGAPLILSEGENTREAASEETARFVDIDDVKAIAGAIDQHLSDPGAARAMGQRARTHALPAYGTEAIWPKLEKFYRDLKES